jgi:hypothetical protein
VSAQRLAYGASVVGFALAAFTTATTLVANEPVVPRWVSFPLFAGIFPVHLLTALVYRGRLREIWLRNPGVLTVGFALLAASAAVSLYQVHDGGPNRVGGAYLVGDRPVSRARYESVSLAQQRLFASVAAFFYLVGLTAHGRTRV